VARLDTHHCSNHTPRLIFAEACEAKGIIPALHKPLEENMMSLFRVQREASEETVDGGRKGKGGGKHTQQSRLVGKGQAAVLLPSSSSSSSAIGLLSLLTVPTPGIPSDSIGHPLAALPKVRYVWHDRSSLPPFHRTAFAFRQDTST